MEWNKSNKYGVIHERKKGSHAVRLVVQQRDEIRPNLLLKQRSILK